MFNVKEHSENLLKKYNIFFGILLFTGLILAGIILGVYFNTSLLEGVNKSIVIGFCALIVLEFLIIFIIFNAKFKKTIKNLPENIDEIMASAHKYGEIDCIVFSEKDGVVVFDRAFPTYIPYEEIKRVYIGKIKIKFGIGKNHLNYIILETNSKIHQISLKNSYNGIKYKENDYIELLKEFEGKNSNIIIGM